MGLPKRWALSLAAALTMVAALGACAEDSPAAPPAVPAKAESPPAAQPTAAVPAKAEKTAAQPASAAAESPPPAKPVIAVADLTYEDRVSDYFTYGESHNSSSSQTQIGGGAYNSDNSTVSASGRITRIERGELHKFTGDIKGALIKSGMFNLIQGRPWTQVDTTVSTDTCMPPNCDGSPHSYSEKVTIYDVIDRIRNGFYDGADYVLFGTVSRVDSESETIPIQGSNAINHSLSMEVLVDFSLIDTRTYQVAAGFSALGEGNDAKLTNDPSAVIALSPARVMKDVSQSLGDAVVREIRQQFPQGSLIPAAASGGNGDQGTVTTYK